MGEYVPIDSAIHSTSLAHRQRRVCERKVTDLVRDDQTSGRKIAGPPNRVKIVFEKYLDFENAAGTLG